MKMQAHDRMLKEAKTLLAESFGGEVLLGEPQPLTEPERRSLVLRIPLAQAPAGSPETVILKSPNLPAVPEAEHEHVRQGFYADWAGCKFLDSLKGGHGPRFFAGSREKQFILVQDFGGMTNMVGPLLEGAGHEAEAALTRYMSRLGRMHAETAGKQAHFEAMAREISAGLPLLRTTILQQAGEVVQGVEANASRYGLAVGDSLRREMQAVVDSALHPGPFLAYIHNDPCPDNLYDDGQEIRLIDFEVSGFGHALVDAVYPRMSFPSCWCANRVPADLVSRLETCYREELVRGVPEAADDRIFGEAVAAACAFWLLIDLGARLNRAEKYPDGIWGLATLFTRIGAHLEAFARTAQDFDCFPEMGEFSMRFGETLGQAWPEHEHLPEYPAFRED